MVSLQHPILAVMAIAVAAPLLAELPVGVRIPVVVLEVVLGVVVGPHALGWVQTGEFLELMQDLLSVEGYKTVICKEGDKAYALVKELQPSLVVLDIRMDQPETGWVVLELLRLDPETTQIPVIVCSADAPFLREKAASLQALRFRSSGSGSQPTQMTVDGWPTRVGSPYSTESVEPSPGRTSGGSLVTERMRSESTSVSGANCAPHDEASTSSSDNGSARITTLLSRPPSAESECR